MKKSLVVGSTGQDGFYLMKHLLKLDHLVYGISRNSPKAKTSISDSTKNFFYKKCDISDANLLNNIISEIKPDYLYFLAGQSSAGLSYIKPLLTYNNNIIGFSNVLESIRLHSPHTKIFNALSSDCFGETLISDATEETIHNPSSPYSLSKTINFNLANYYIKNHGIFISNIFLFNHESIRRNKNFVTQKIISSAKQIKKKKLNSLKIGNINVIRDWGWAPEFVTFFPRFLDLPSPENYILATGETYKLETFIKYAFDFYDLNYLNFIDIDESFIRNNDPIKISANISKLKNSFNDYPKLSVPNVVEKLMRNEDF